MDNGFVYYTRSYKKIFLIISNVFPIFRLLLYFMKKFTQHIKMSIIKRKLAGVFFVVVLNVGTVKKDGNEHSILLGRPFMATTQCLNDVGKKNRI